jgi:tRNA(Arg) A34 adenosine deaminase TadA
LCTKREENRIMISIDERDAVHLRRAIALAREAREKGNAPFGAVLVDEEGRFLAEGRNTVNTERDVTAHAEANLIRAAFRTVDEETFASSTLYASGEPCAMCSGAIGLGAARLYEMFPPDEANPVISLSCREVLAAGTRRTEVIGPVLEAEAELVFEGLA